MPPAEIDAWDYGEWIEYHKDYMIRQSSNYMSYYGTMSAADADIYWQTYSE